MRTASLRKLTVGAVAAGLVLTGCGTTAEGGSASDSGGDGPIEGLRFMVPNSPGSGYDTTARAVAAVMEDEEIATGIEVFNLEGAGGTVGLQRLVNEEATPTCSCRWASASSARSSATSPRPPSTRPRRSRS